LLISRHRLEEFAMRQALILVAIVGAVISPMSFAQSAQGSDPRPSTADAGPASRDAAPASKAHRAMASFNSLLREAALQSQAAQRAAASTQPAAQPVRPAPDARDDLAATPDPAVIH
jgi:hypothetical protein